MTNRLTQCRRRDVALLAVVFLLILSYIWGWQDAFRGAAAVFSIALTGALVSSHAAPRESLRDAGFRLDTIAPAATMLGPVAGMLIAISVIVGQMLGSTHFPQLPDALAAMPSMFAFALAQQYVLLGFFYRRFERLFGKPRTRADGPQQLRRHALQCNSLQTDERQGRSRGRASAIRNLLPLVATALVFAFFHLPNAFLTIVTFCAGLLCAAVYQRAPNLWVSAMAHALISFHLYHALPLDITGAFRVGPGYWH